MLLVEFNFYLVAYWGKLMILIFTCAWGCRKQKIKFLNLNLSKTLSHWRCTFNVLKFNYFFNPHISFNKITLHYFMIKISFKTFNISIDHYLR